MRELDDLTFAMIILINHSESESFDELSNKNFGFS